MTLWSIRESASGNVDEDDDNVEIQLKKEDDLDTNLDTKET
jgi:hypothetical protein